MQKQTNIKKVFRLNELGFKGCVDFGYYHYSSVEPVLETHSHKEVMEICFCLKGQQYYQIENHLFKLTGNSILIVPPNVKHSSGVNPEDIGELFWLQIVLPKKSNLCNLTNDQSDYLFNELLKKGNTLYKGAFSLKHILKRIVETLEKSKNIINELYINQLLIQLLLETYFLTKEPERIINPERLNIINDFIAKNIHRTIYVDELATLINISTAYFKFWFKHNIGIPPKMYINRLKIEQAKIDLPQRKTITIVAFELGFSSSQYFTTIFKKHTGFTPKAYITSMIEKQ